MNVCVCFFLMSHNRSHNQSPMVLPNRGTNRITDQSHDLMTGLANSCTIKRVVLQSFRIGGTIIIET